MKKARRSTRLAHTGSTAPTTVVPVIPKLTRGGLLVDRLVTAMVRSIQKPRDLGLLEAASESRLSIEKYITNLEKAAGQNISIENNRGGRVKSKGWGVSKTITILVQVPVDEDGIRCGPCDNRNYCGESPQYWITCNLFDDEDVTDGKRCSECLKYEQKSP